MPQIIVTGGKSYRQKVCLQWSNKNEKWLYLKKLKKTELSFFVKNDHLDPLPTPCCLPADMPPPEELCCQPLEPPPAPGCQPLEPLPDPCCQPPPDPCCQPLGLFVSVVTGCHPWAPVLLLLPLLPLLLWLFWPCWLLWLIFFEVWFWLEEILGSITVSSHSFERLLTLWKTFGMLLSAWAAPILCPPFLNPCSGGQRVLSLHIARGMLWHTR